MFTVNLVKKSEERDMDILYSWIKRNVNSSDWTILDSKGVIHKYYASEEDFIAGKELFVFRFRKHATMFKLKFG